MEPDSLSAADRGHAGKPFSRLDIAERAVGSDDLNTKAGMAVRLEIDGSDSQAEPPVLRTRGLDVPGTEGAPGEVLAQVVRAPDPAARTDIARSTWTAWR